MISGGIRVGGCLSTCIFMSGTVEVNKRVRIAPTGCNGGYGCCQTSILPLLQYLELQSSRETALNDTAYAFIADKEWLGNDFNVTAYKENPTAKRPVVLDWVIGNGTCETANPSSNCGPNSYCRNVTSGDGYACFCNRGYEGNPYLPQGCHDIDECADTKTNDCGWTCVNGPGNYSCSCPHGYHGDGKKIGVGCMKEKEVKRYIPWVIGIGSSFTILLLLLGSFWLYQLHKKIKSRKMKENFFKQNGGLLLQHQISSEESNVEKTKIFLAEELEKATDHYSINRILGQGGQGTVYKGMLVDGRIVAVKKSKKLDEEVDKDQVEQFINEVVILSQINHRNVVKLLGCCLETEVPLLVYEFISNGTLFHYTHNQSEDFIFTWENRLRIAIEVAGALSYLHSSAATPIYHRDIKSTNILLDDKYRAKVSDFGTSKSIAIDKTHLTTRVQGTFGYLDPEYFQTNQFTDKSDVYSFGVVLVELLTGEKPISSTRSGEGKNLANYFISSIKENRLFEILDVQVVKGGEKDDIEVVANLAKRCLNLNSKKRPTMREVSIELEGLRMSAGHTMIQQNLQQVESFIAVPSSIWDGASTSNGFRSLESSVTVPLDDQPLLFNTSSYSC